MMKRKGQAASTIVLGVLGVIAIGTILSSVASVSIGDKAVLTSWNKVDAKVLSSGFSVKAPWTEVHSMNIRQQKSDIFKMYNVYNVDKQSVTVDCEGIIYNLPSDDKSLKDLYANYSGDPFRSFVLPKVKSAIMTVTGRYNVDDIVHQHDKYVNEIMEVAQKNIGDIVTIDSIIIPNVTLDKEIEKAIRDKQVAAMNIQTARNNLEKAKVQAQTAVATAKGEAEAKLLMAKAVTNNQSVVELSRIEKGQDMIPMGAKVVYIGANVPLVKDTSTDGN